MQTIDNVFCIKGSNKKMNLTINQLEDITNATNLHPLILGESIQKFTGNYKGQKVIFRIYPNNDYYQNRFEREGAALEAIAKEVKHVLLDEQSIIVPDIVDEWPTIEAGYSIRALSWIHGQAFASMEPYLDFQLVTDLIDLMKRAGKHFPTKFSFEQDVVKKLTQPLNKEQENEEKWIMYLQLITEFLEQQNKTKLTITHLIHGDFHEGNILQIYPTTKEQEPKYAIIDWEFATKGSIYYDLAYAQEYSKVHPPLHLQREVNAWKGFAISSLTHWYMINERNSKNSDFWLKKLEHFVKKI